jgi:signal transduction histidine kinase/ActR/RegA family two-component response regulator
VSTAGQERDGAAGDLAGQVRERLGVLPNFFRPAPGTEPLLAGLWAFTQAAYLDSPLPSLFKERLFVHLSRFCEVRYCIIRHACFLAGLGRPAGDPDAPAQAVEQITGLLRRPVAPAMLEASLRRLEAIPGPVVMPDPGTQLETDLFDALAVIFLDAEQAARARAAVTAAAGNPGAELLLGLLAFIRTAHYWTELHPDLSLEPDAIAFLDQQPQLARLLTDPADAAAASPRAAWHAAAADLAAARESLAASEQALSESVDAGFNLVQATPGNRHSRYRVTESNSAQARLTGRPAAAGRPARDLIPGAADELTACLERVDVTGEPARFETHLSSPDRWLDISVFRAATPHGPMLAVACRDITDKVRAAADREAQQRAQRDFVANAAHELRTPLTAVIAAIDTLDRGAIHDPAGRDRFFGHIRREAARLSRLCDSLLLLADTQSGSPQRPTAIRLRPMLDDIADGLTAAPGVTVTVEAPAQLTVTTNPGLLERILDNLTQNAAKYTVSGQITLHASAADAAVTVTVQDTGQGLGLPAAEAVKRFSRGGARTADGFGLGLSIAHQAALALGATLYLHDNPGGGTIATLTLPHAPTASASILVIEDEDAIRDAITYTLRTAGYQVTEAATGQHGLAAARQEHFELIIVDLLLPDIPGTDLTRQLRAEGDGDGRHILAITAQTAVGTRDLALSAGADQFMTKPFAMNQLLERARALTAPTPPNALHPGQHRTSQPAGPPAAITAGWTGQ